MDDPVMKFEFEVKKWQLGAACIAASLFGTAYSWFLKRDGRWLSEEEPDIATAIGVAGTLLAMWIAFPVQVVLAFLGAFGLTGGPQIIRNAVLRREQAVSGAATVQKAAASDQT